MTFTQHPCSLAYNLHRADVSSGASDGAAIVAATAAAAPAARPRRAGLSLCFLAALVTKRLNRSIVTRAHAPRQVASVAPAAERGRRSGRGGEETKKRSGQETDDGGGRARGDGPGVHGVREHRSCAECAGSTHRPGPGPSAAGGAARVRSHCRFTLPLIHFIPDSRTYSVSLFLKRRCDRTLGAADADGRGRLSLGASVLSFSLFGLPRCSSMANGSRRAFYLHGTRATHALQGGRRHVSARWLQGRAAEAAAGGAAEVSAAPRRSAVAVGHVRATSRPGPAVRGALRASLDRDTRMARARNPGRR